MTRGDPRLPEIRNHRRRRRGRYVRRVLRAVGRPAARAQRDSREIAERQPRDSRDGGDEPRRGGTSRGGSRLSRLSPGLQAQVLLPRQRVPRLPRPRPRTARDRRGERARGPISANLGGSRLEAVGEESGREDVAAHASELLAAAPKMLAALEASLAKHDRLHCLRVCSPRLHYCIELVVNLRSASLTPSLPSFRRPLVSDPFL